MNDMIQPKVDLNVDWWVECQLFDLTGTTANELWRFLCSQTRARAGNRRPPIAPGSRGELMQRSLHGRQNTMLVDDAQVCLRTLLHLACIISSKASVQQEG